MTSYARLQQAKALVAAVVAIARDEQLTFLAAAIAYYAFVSLFPLAILAVAVATAVGGSMLAETVVSSLSEILTPAGQEVLEEALVTGRGRGGATVVGLVVLVWTALKVFRAIDRSFSAVYGEGLSKPLSDQLAGAGVALAAVGFAGVIASVVAIAVNLIDLPYNSLVGGIVSMLALALIFFPMYYLFPGTEMEFHEAIPGSLFAAVSWTVLSILFSIYASYAGAYAVYGVVGGVLLLVTWLYVGALVLLVGAALNAALSGRMLAVDTDLAADVDRHLQSAGLRQDEPTGNRDDV